MTNSEGYEIKWSDGQTGLEAINLCPGTYQVSITSPQNCNATSSIEIVAQSEIVTTISAEPGDCKKLAVVTADALGGALPYTFNWSNGSTAKVINDLPNGDYQLTVTDANGCVVMDEIEINNSSELLTFETEIQQVNCYDESTGAIAINMLTGTIPLQYEWSTGDTTAMIQTLPAGNYSLKVTDGNNCVVAQSFSINQPDSLALSFNTLINEATKTGTIELTVSGGVGPFTYLWSNGATSVNVNDLPYGNYSVEVIDANGCSAVASILLGTVSNNEITFLQDLSLFPNPTTNRFYLQASFLKVEDLTLTLFNILGKRVHIENFKTRNLSWSFDVQHLPKGVYLLQLKNREGQVSRRVVVD